MERALCAESDLQRVQSAFHPIPRVFIASNRYRSFLFIRVNAAMTREEDLTRIAKKLDKMVSRNNTDGAMDLLRELKSFNMTLKLLQETRIGMSVNGVRKNSPDEDVIALAKLLIKDWKRLLDLEKAAERTNGLDASKTAASPKGSPSETKSRRLYVKLKHASSPEKKHADKSGKERRERRTDDPSDDEELGYEKQEEEVKKEKNSVDPQRKDKHREESRNERPMRSPQWDKPLSEPQREKATFERRGVMDSSLLYPTRFPSPPRPARPPLPIKRPCVDLKKDRKDSKDSSSRHPRPHAPSPASPPASRLSLEVKKERKVPPDPNAPIAPLPLHLHPPAARKETPDPNAPLPPLPLRLHPPPPPLKSPSLDGKKERRTESSDSKPPAHKKTPDPVKRQRKDSVDTREPKKHSGEAKTERKDSSDSKPPLLKKPSLDVKKEKPRKDSCDSKPGQPARHKSADSKPDRRESTDSMKSSSPPTKKLTVERRGSQGLKTSQPGPPQRKPSTDTMERKGKGDAPKTPTSPTSPMSPGASSAGGPVPPHLATGDPVRDKCIYMLAAALRTDNHYKDFGTNCDSMAAEIEDYIYQETKATDMKYKNRVRSRISNLKDPKNPGLRRNVLAGSIDLSRIASMSAQEMASDELKQLRNVLTQEAIREHQMAKTGGTSTDLLQCGKCKKRNCTYNQVQTRSADEPMTTFVLCNECGNRWKFC
ncbi:transcription elongation factor A protein 3 isoform 2-T2 [Spinachia spinachia]